MMLHQATNPTPSGILAPLAARKNPNTKNAPPITPVKMVKTLLIFSVRLPQFIATAVAIIAAPIAMRPIPKGILTPEKPVRLPKLKTLHLQ